MLNFGTTQLDQILNMEQSMCNQNGLGYTSVVDSIATTSKIVFVKATPTTANRYFPGKNAKPPLHEDNVKMFVHICHLCNMPDHIRSKCFKYKNIFMMNRMEQLYYKPRIALKHNKFEK